MELIDEQNDERQGLKELQKHQKVVFLAPLVSVFIVLICEYIFVSCFRRSPEIIYWKLNPSWEQKPQHQHLLNVEGWVLPLQVLVWFLLHLCVVNRDGNSNN